MDYKLPKRYKISNKATYGKVLNIAGSDYMSGAAYLSSISALKMGCGYCFLCSSERVINCVGAQTQNIVFVPESDLESQILVADVVSIGCGLSMDKRAFDIFDRVIKALPHSTPLIIDADGINILSKNNNEFLTRNLENVILTPHPKEASRLLGIETDEILNNIEFYSQEISKKYNCITALKSHNTIVTSADFKIYKNTTGNNSMAKAGSGDVLTGMISGLVAQGLDLFSATVTAVYLHGLSGDLAKEKLTEYSVMAEDLISYIPNAIKILLA